MSARLKRNDGQAKKKTTHILVYLPLGKNANGRYTWERLVAAACKQYMVSLQVHPSDFRFPGRYSAMPSFQSEWQVFFTLLLLSSHA